MKFNQINEAIINVPNELLSKVNLYVSTVLAFKLTQFSQRLDMLAGNNTSPDEKQKIKSDIQQTVAKLQQKYGAKNISANTYATLDNKNIALNIDFDNFFKELNYKGITPEIVDIVSSTSNFELYIIGGSSTSAGSVSNDGKTVKLMIHIGKLDPRNSLNSANSIMRTVYHECQHVVQEFALKSIQKYNSTSSKTPKQLDMGDNYGDAGEGYYTSGVEYTPQLGDVINTVSDILERDAIQGKLDGKLNRAINNALVDAYQEDVRIRTFLGHIRKNDSESYKKALKAIYTKVAPVYNELKTKGVDYRYSDLEPEVLEANINVMATILRIVRNKSDYFTLNGTQRGNTIKWLSLESNKEGWKVTIAPKSSGEYQVSFDYQNYDDIQNLDTQALLNFVGMITENTYYDAEDVLSILDSYVQRDDDITEQNILNIKEQLSNDAKYLNVPFENQDNGNFVVAGLPLSLSVDEDDKSKVIISDSSDNLYFVLPTIKLINLAQAFIRACAVDQDEAKKVLLDFDSYITKINKLRNM